MLQKEYRLKIATGSRRVLRVAENDRAGNMTNFEQGGLYHHSASILIQRFNVLQEKKKVNLFTLKCE